MNDLKQPDLAPEPPRVRGLLADFATPGALLEAAGELREAGYHRLEAYTPFPVHGLDKVLRIPASRLPWIVLCAGLGGGVIALVGQWWTSAVDYPLVISGKPLFSLPANIPVAFEVVILLSALAAFCGMLALNRLPQLANPLFEKRRFRRATSHRFLLFVEARDPRFALEATRQLLMHAGADAVEVCADSPDPAARRIPRPLLVAAVLIGCTALIPPLLVARARQQTSNQPRLHLVKDMDSQPKFAAQSRSTLFADGRAMRPAIAGTIARGELRGDLQLNRGVERAGAESPGHDEEVAWVESVPLPASLQLIERGRERYNIYCAACHGRSGHGDGLVSLRALELQQGTWVPPTSLHADHVRAQPVGQLFHVISHGVRKMPGYAAQIEVADRWAIVMYLRALQRSQNARLSDVPAELRDSLRDLN